MQSDIPGLRRADRKANDQAKVVDLLQLRLRVGLVVQNVAFTHLPVFVSLVLRWHQDWEYARAQLSANIFHQLAIGPTRINTAFAFEVGANNAIVIAFTTPPRLPVSWLIFLHALEQLGEESVAVAAVCLALYGNLGCLVPEEVDFNA